MNLGTWLERTARHDPDRPALFLGQDQVATYGQLARLAGCTARGAGYAMARFTTALGRLPPGSNARVSRSAIASGFS